MWVNHRPSPLPYRPAPTSAARQRFSLVCVSKLVKGMNDHSAGPAQMISNQPSRALEANAHVHCFGSHIDLRQARPQSKHHTSAMRMQAAISASPNFQPLLSAGQSRALTRTVDIRFGRRPSLI